MSCERVSLRNRERLVAKNREDSQSGKNCAVAIVCYQLDRDNKRMSILWKNFTNLDLAFPCSLKNP